MDDFVPEHCDYRDGGCDLFPSCLRCPLTRCRYDQPGKHAGRELRDSEMRRLHAGGMGVRELARRFAVSKRTVYRAIAGDANHRAATVASGRDIEVAHHE